MKQNKAEVIEIVEEEISFSKPLTTLDELMDSLGITREELDAPFRLIDQDLSAGRQFAGQSVWVEGCWRQPRVRVHLRFPPGARITRSFSKDPASIYHDRCRVVIARTEKRGKPEYGRRPRRGFTKPFSEAERVPVGGVASMQNWAEPGSDDRTITTVPTRLLGRPRRGKKRQLWVVVFVDSILLVALSRDEAMRRAAEVHNRQINWWSPRMAGALHGRRVRRRHEGGGLRNVIYMGRGTDGYEYALLSFRV